MEVKEMNINKLYVSKHNIRKTAIVVKDLVDSIKKIGIMEPLIARPSKEKPDHFEVVAGQRRFVAAKEAGLETVPVIIRDLNDTDAARFSMIENIHQQSLSVIDLANTVKMLTDMEMQGLPERTGIPYGGRLFPALRKVSEQVSWSHDTLHKYYNMAARLSKKTQNIIESKDLGFEIAYTLSWLPKNLQEQYAKALKGFPDKEAVRIIFMARDKKLPIQKAIKIYMETREVPIKVSVPTGVYEKIGILSRSLKQSIEETIIEMIKNGVKGVKLKKGVK
jgi:vacuolar-type H+-ATPase subunit F/Vma7